MAANLAAYLASLERDHRVEARSHAAGARPCHRRSRAAAARLRQHRLEREEQVIAALRAGATTPEEVVARVYRGLKESLVPLALESVTAHLLKLEQDGRAQMRDEAWIMIDA